MKQNLFSLRFISDCHEFKTFFCNLETADSGSKQHNPSHSSKNTSGINQYAILKIFPEINKDCLWVLAFIDSIATGVLKQS